MHPTAKAFLLTLAGIVILALGLSLKSCASQRQPSREQGDAYSLGPGL